MPHWRSNSVWTEGNSVYDVAVLGLGAVGSMTAWRCAIRGARVIGVERFTPVHHRGSSHGGARIFRQSIFEGAEYLPLIARAKTLWHDLQNGSGATILNPCGALYIGPPDSDFIRDAQAAGRTGGFAQQVLDPDRLAAAYPQHGSIGGDVGVFEPGAGLLDPQVAILAAQYLAGEAGARLTFETVVTAVDGDDSGVRIRTDSEVISARVAVVANGAWFNDLTPSLRLPLRVQRSSALFFTPRDLATAYGPDRFPAFIRRSPGIDGWGVPNVDGTGVKIGAGAGADKPWLAHADDNNYPLDADDTEPAEKFCRKALPGITPKVAAGWPCMNLKTPDLDFIIGTAERAPGLILAGGFSGHGFKHASGVGDVVADLALDGHTDIALDRFSPDRFID